MTSFAPQLMKIWRERDASQVSLRMYLVTVTGFVLWTAYGILIGRWPVAVSNAVCLAMSGAVLVLKLKFDRAGPATRIGAGGGLHRAFSHWRQICAASGTDARKSDGDEGARRAGSGFWGERLT